MTWPGLAVCIVVAYLIGAIPFSWLFVRVLKGIDLRTVGSGNLGSTNATRVLGVPLGLTIQVLDIFKGWVPVFLAGFLEQPSFYHQAPESRIGILESGPPISFEYAAMMVGLAAILGHMFPVYMKFRGGKGVNTSLGVFLALAPKAMLAALGVGLVILALTRYVSLCSIAGAISFPFAVWLLYPSHPALLVVAVTVGLLIVVMHRSNVRRLLAGTEPRLGRKIAAEERGENRLGHQ
jgi:glycerol-3-phosphate acyltransferase PlsY